VQALEVRDVTVNECGRQTRSCLVEAQWLSPRDAGQRMWVARHLPLFPAVAAAFNAGEINFEHVRVILGCLLKLSPEWRTASEGQLLDFAREHDPGMLAQLGRDLRVLTGADESAEAAAQRKYASRYLSLNSTFENLGAEDERGTTQSTALTTKGLCGRGGRLRTLGPAQMAMIMKRPEIRPSVCEGLCTARCTQQFTHWTRPRKPGLPPGPW